MSNINSVAISGNLTRDPELRTTANGGSVLTLGVAVNDAKKNPQTGEWEDYPNFFNAILFGKRAESLNKYLQKGSKVFIMGKLHFSQWETDGNKRSKVEIIANEIEFFNRENNAQNNAQTAQEVPANQSSDASLYDADIPF